MSDLHQHITDEWLTKVLQEHGHLAHDGNASIHHLRVIEYPHSVHITFDAMVDRQTSTPLLVKLTRPHAARSARRETTFYTHIAPLLPGVPLVACYGTGTLANGTIFVLLADISATHEVRTSNLSKDDCYAILGALAQLHAACWQRQDIFQHVEASPQEALDDMFPDPGQQHLELMETFGDRLDGNQRHIIEHYYTSVPHLFRQRLQQDHALTLCHPDSIAENFLLPRSPHDPIYSIDWHKYRIWWGAVDVATFITRSTLPFYPGSGDALLQHYYRALRALGVDDYGWRQCLEDYRLGLSDTLRVVVSMGATPDPALILLTTVSREYERVSDQYSMS